MLLSGLTKIKIEFQYKGEDDARPVDAVQVESIQFEAPGNAPAGVLIPAVGDTVTVTLTSDKQEDFKVLTRHFSCLETELGLYIIVNIVVTDVGDAEMGVRL